MSGSHGDPRPHLTLRLAVTGHRAGELDASATATVESAADCLIGHLIEMLAALKNEHAEIWADETPELRIISGLATGTDMIFTRHAMEKGCALNAILPYPAKRFAQEQGFDSAELAQFEEACREIRSQGLLELSPGQDQHAYEALGRHLVAQADLLVAVWNGEAAKGPGGTGQVVEIARDQGVPVIWLNLDGRIQILREVEAGDVSRAPVDQIKALAPDLRDTLQELLGPPQHDDADDGGAGPRAKLERFLDEHPGSEGRRKHYRIIRKLAHRQTAAPDPDENWSRFLSDTASIGGTAFCERLSQRLYPRYRLADSLAVETSDNFRSTYISNFALGALAVIAGLLSVFFWSADASVYLKALFILVEIAIVLRILFQTGHGRKKQWKDRWTEYRALAELLRPARLPALLGRSASPGLPKAATGQNVWIQWYTRSTLREIPVPTLVQDTATLEACLDTALATEIDGQIAYNRHAGAAYDALDHWLHEWGEVAFRATLWIGVMFLAYAGLYLLAQIGVSWLSLVKNSMVKEGVKAVVTVAGAGLPALGAALNGIRAMGDFKVASAQAERTCHELERVREDLRSLAGTPDAKHLRFQFERAAQACAQNLADWSDIYRLKALTLPA